MFTVEEKTSVFGVSELRQKTNELLEELKKGRVLLTRRNQPLAIILDMDEYRRLRDLDEESENNFLLKIAETRSKTKAKRKNDSHEEIKKILDL